MAHLELSALTMDQVRAMDNITLRVQVAMLLGWSDIHEQWIEWKGKRIFDYQGVPAGAGGHDARLPNWVTYLDDAIELVAGLEWTLGPDRYQGEIACSIEWGANLDYGREHCVEEYARQPARAVTLAWVAWKLAQGE